jgi:hypothetical protein
LALRLVRLGDPKLITGQQAGAAGAVPSKRRAAAGRSPFGQLPVGAVQRAPGTWRVSTLGRCRGCSAVRVKADPDVDADQAATSAIEVQVADRHHAQDHAEDAGGWSHSWAVPCRWIFIGAVLLQDGALGAVATRAPSLLSIRRAEDR